MKILIDMMGGDNGIDMTIPTVKKFLSLHDDLELFLVGDENRLTNEFKDYKNCTIVPSTTIVPMDADPLSALHDKESSLMKGIKAFLENGCEAFISAGSTGALLSAATLKIKRLPGITRPALVTSFPTIKKNKKFVVTDLGANNVATKEELLQFAIMGSLYYKTIYNDNETPRVFLLNNGTEEEKGTEVLKETYQLMKESKSINFCGNMEAREPLKGDLDVLVADGFNGNIFLKTMEGTAKQMSGMLKDIFKRNFISKLAYLMVRKGVNEMKQKMDYKNVGGALLAGVNGVVVKAHGSADEKCFLSALENAYKLVKVNIIEKFKEEL